MNVVKNLQKVGSGSVKLTTHQKVNIALLVVALLVGLATLAFGL